MGSNPAEMVTEGLGENALVVRLYRQAGRRWALLAGALALLAVLGILAGHVRNPDAVKRGWAVTASRVLAGVGAVFLVRLMLFPYDERVPVLFFDLRSDREAEGLLGWISDVVGDLKNRGFETIPLGDVVEFIREQRYVPKKGFALVIEAGGIRDLEEIAGALEGLEITVLLPPGIEEADIAKGMNAVPPTGVSLGVGVPAGDGSEDSQGLRTLLADFKRRVAARVGGGPIFARIGARPGVDLRKLLKETGYTCFLDGTGFNRYGDEPHMLRLLNATASVAAGKGGRGLAMYIGLFKAKHYLWPAVRMMGLMEKGPRET
jgi:hypothetical protein